MRPSPALLVLLVAGCAPAPAAILPVDPDPHPLPAAVDVRLATEIDGVATVLDVYEDGTVEIVAEAAVRASKSHVALDPQGRWWAVCDRALDFGDATLHAGVLGDLTDLGLPADCHHPTLDARGGLTWGQFGDGPSRMRRHDLDGEPLKADDTRARGTLWHPRVDPTGRWATAVVSTGSDIGPILVVDLDADAPEGFLTRAESRGGWRDVAFGRIAAASGGEVVLIDPATRAEEAWTVFDVPCLDDNDLPCGFLTRDPRLSDDGRVALIGTPVRGGTEDPDWEVFIADGPGEVRRLTDDTHRDERPVWGHSGQWVYWIRDLAQIVRMQADGSGSPQVLLEGSLTGWTGLESTRPAD